MYMNKIIYIVALSFLIVMPASAEVIDKVRGHILLQVEERGEAWYVTPEKGERIYLQTPYWAYNIMRSQGVGISSSNLDKIPVGVLPTTLEDTDGDGLHNLLEEALRTNSHSKDSDGDGYDDYLEIINGYNPHGRGKMGIDMFFAKKQVGKILLDVEHKGEAWYVNPQDVRRYYLGRPADAFEVMKKLGLGITNKNLELISIHSLSRIPLKTLDIRVYSPTTKNLAVHTAGGMIIFGQDVATGIWGGPITVPSNKHVYIPFSHDIGRGVGTVWYQKYREGTLDGDRIWVNGIEECTFLKNNATMSSNMQGWLLVTGKEGSPCRTYGFNDNYKRELGLQYEVCMLSDKNCLDDPRNTK